MPDFIPPARPVIGDDEIDAAVRVLRSGMVVQGPEVAGFEEDFGALVEGRHCVAVNSGTSALQLALMAMGVGSGDEVIVPSFSFAATANAVRLAGAEPVFVDIEPDHFNVDPAAVEAAVGPRTAAIMPVHLYGHPADMDRDQCDRRAARARRGRGRGAGARCDVGGRPVGAFGTTGASASTRPRTCTARGRHGHHLRRDSRADRAAAAQPGHGAALRQRDRRREHAAHRRRGCGRPGPADQALRVEQAAPGERSVPVRRAARGRCPGGRPEASHVWHQYTIRVPLPGTRCRRR